MYSKYTTSQLETALLNSRSKTTTRNIMLVVATRIEEAHARLHAAGKGEAADKILIKAIKKVGKKY